MQRVEKRLFVSKNQKEEEEERKEKHRIRHL
jgi:hypothetical protein